MILKLEDFGHPLWQVYVPSITMGFKKMSLFLSKILGRTHFLQQYILIKAKIAQLEDRRMLYQINFDK